MAYLRLDKGPRTMSFDAFKAVRALHDVKTRLGRMIAAGTEHTDEFVAALKKVQEVEDTLDGFNNELPRNE